MGIAEKFETFCSNLAISNETRSKISTRYKAITKRLNKDFWDIENENAFSRYIGSFGRGTAIQGFSDLDMVFILPKSIYDRYNAYLGNGQSSMLQEVKSSIANTYWNSNLGTDGIVVTVDFSDDIYFEVIPVFDQTNGSYIHALTSNGGSWKNFHPVSEITAIDTLNDSLNGNLKRLCKMIRAWINTWNVPMGGLLADTLAYNFIKDYSHKNQSFLYYDLYSRDFFNYLAKQNPNQTYWYAPGSNQFVYRSAGFEYKAKRCYNLALEAIQYGKDGHDWSANNKWREIYGTNFPS